MTPTPQEGNPSIDDAGVAMPGNSVGFVLSQVGLETSRQFGEVVGALGLEPRHFAVLYAVQRSKGQLQQTIGDRLAIPPSTMVAIIDRLEGEALLERRPHATDRRARTLFLTKQGETLLSEALTRAMDQEVRICTGIEPEQRAQLLALLHRISINLGVSSSALPDRGSGERPQRL